MVGVKGKFKGCNTCRARRVQCDQTRPLCRNCTDHNRTCEGYHKETVFIIGTPQDKGRCASHPPRNIGNRDSSKKSKKPKVEKNSGDESSTSHATSPFSSASSPGSVSGGNGGGGGSKSKETARLVPRITPIEQTISAVQPPRPSWEECLSVASVSGRHYVRFVALETQLSDVSRFASGSAAGCEEVRLRIPCARKPEYRSASGREEFHLTGQCLVHLSQSGSGRVDRSLLGGEGICLFLYEHNYAAAYSNKAPWNDYDALHNPVRQLGPAGFRSFPAHHFFTRVYRPNAIFTSILNRVPTILAQDDWQSVPWETSAPKTPLDRLLDMLARLPTLLSRTDRVLPLAPSNGRLKAHDLLANFVILQNDLEIWYAGIEEAASHNRACPLLYWVRKGGTADGEEGQIPFADTYDFASPVIGLAHIYYWTGLIVMYSAMGRLIKYMAMSQSRGGGGALGATSSPSAAASPLPSVIVTPAAASYHHVQPHSHQRGYGHGPGPTHARGHSYDYGSPRPSTPNSYGSPAGGSSSASVSTASSPPYFSPPPPAPTSTYRSGAGSGGARLAMMPTISAGELPRGVDPARYRPREIRKLAANVCRSLDWAVGRSRAIDGLGPLGQPDLVAAPLAAVERFYSEIRDLGDGELERLWCLGFRERLDRRTRDVTGLVVGGSGAEGGSALNEVGSRGWLEVGEFGG